MRVRTGWGAALAALCAVSGCAGSRAATASDPRQATGSAGSLVASRQSATATAEAELRNSVILDADLRTEAPAVSGAWLGYGVALAAERKKSRNAPPDRFTEELRGRQRLIEVWRELRRDVPNRYLDTLAEVEAAGLLPEYVLAQLAVPGWAVPGPAVRALRLDAWEAYRKQHLAGHSAETRAQLSEVASLPSPGAEFADVIDERLARSQAGSCAKLLPDFAGATTEVERRLQPLPELLLSVKTREELVETLRDPDVAAAAARGARWIAPTVAKLYMAAGFCAVEGEDLPLSERYLRRLLALSPRHESGVAELAHVLIGQTRYPEALAQIDRGLQLTRNPCNQAMLWRKRGYVFIELRRLPDAREAYLKSLELQPGNELARHELKLIAQMLGEPNFDDVEPPAAATLTTSCPQ